MSKLRIAVFSWEIPNGLQIGGIATYLNSIHQPLSELADITYIGIIPESAGIEANEIKMVGGLYHLEDDWANYILIPVKIEELLADKRKYWSGREISIDKILEITGDIDAILVHDDHLAPLVYKTAKKLERNPPAILWFIHSYKYLVFTDIITMLSDIVIANSRRTLSRISDKVGGLETTIIYPPAPIPTEPLTIEDVELDNYFVFIGRGSEEKGIFELLHAWKIFKKKTRKLQGDRDKETRKYDLVITGRGVEELRAIIDDPTIHVFENITEDTKYSLLRSALGVVMPSIDEPFGIVAHESMLAETPLLLSKESGATEIYINNRHCKYIDPHNPISIAQKMLFLAEAQETAKKMALAGKHIAMTFKPERTAHEIMEKIYYLL